MQVDVPIRRHSKLSLTPLIDVIFLLLLFFMLSSTFSSYAEISLSTGGGKTTPPARPDIILFVAKGELKLNGIVSRPAMIGDQLEALRESGAERLLVLVEANAASQDFVAVIAEANKVNMPVTVARQRR
ncbi:biopolymer transporter ExbD [Pseudohoeflea coraliihabitans]|uniref:Biopolymer transporter ExbD n=1 Tax=Pseudohoeflea coraliihabitans TaxID=2860393 RepID=A0ABS6WP25_9HYPH|nr:biopolymer transporter ExbD [Pseudohoeflea sp. DP4N28-3]MBW3097714.1 biopolymer transporter ExbD [Pseudohoeflea sp. DP4N28-3]